jgi:integrase
VKGYIRKRGKVYSFTVDIGKDPITGKRKQKTRSGFKTKKEAQAALAELINKVEKGESVDFRKNLFKEFALDYFQKTYVNKIKATSYDRLSIVLNKQILPYFKDISITEIDQFVVHDFYNLKLKEGYSTNYITRMHEIIRMLLRVAKKWDLIQKDIASMIEAPKNKRKEMKVWSIDQVNQFLEFSSHSRYYPIFFLAAYTGMRKGEILALTWEDIDFDQSIIYVNKTLYKLTDRYSVDTPKSSNSIREIYFDDEIRNVLKRHRLKQKEEKLKNSRVYDDKNLVFAQEDGMYVPPPSANILMKEFIRQSGLPKIRFHDLRHTHATILLQMGVNPKVVSDRLGHSSVQITLDVYSHVTKEIKQDISKDFSNMMKSGQNVVSGNE